MVVAGYAVELLFGATGLVPTERNATVLDSGVVVELHDVAQHRVPRAGRGPGDPVRAHRRHRDAAHDGRRARTTITRPTIMPVTITQRPTMPLTIMPVTITPAPDRP